MLLETISYNVYFFLIANIVTTSKALVTSSDALVPSSFLPPPRARALAREKVLVDSFASNYKCLASSNKCLTSSNKKLLETSAKK